MKNLEQTLQLSCKRRRKLCQNLISWRLLAEILNLSRLRQYPLKRRLLFNLQPKLPCLFPLPPPLQHRL